MPELRHDPIQRRWVIISSERSRRPAQFHPPKVPDSEGEFCPFCPGHEGRTPNPIATVEENGRWAVRVVANKFPALAIEGDLDRRGRGLYDRMNGIGAHEVVIETPDHHAALSDLGLDAMVRLFEVYRDRLIDLRRDHRFRYVLIFKNHGWAAGASLVHSHSQIIATPVTPKTIGTELMSAREHFRVKERCLFCDLVDQEIRDQERIVSINDHFLAFCPYASRFPFETMVLPRQHQHDYARMQRETAYAFAEIMKDLLRRLRHGLADPAYNFMLHTAPNTETFFNRSGYWDTLAHDWHWHIEVLPRLTHVAGFEWGTGFYINPVAPEEAALHLREVELP